ncbi:hypothetical protein CRE_03425 [Caenorhabditis remanei]|uniref:Uncharacterized protein n=1 Tax=Caenorhabditis remanei TaxID=31234 RepID=E3NAN3_CAERE|nr:hypothetical protein CRE_03425 [Caenorhabditis remanei]
MIYIIPTIYVVLRIFLVFLKCLVFKNRKKVRRDMDMDVFTVVVRSNFMRAFFQLKIIFAELHFFISDYLMYRFPATGILTPWCSRIPYYNLLTNNLVWMIIGGIVNVSKKGKWCPMERDCTDLLFSRNRGSTRNRNAEFFISMTTVSMIHRKSNQTQIKEFNLRQGSQKINWIVREYTCFLKMEGGRMILVFFSASGLFF